MLNEDADGSPSRPVLGIETAGDDSLKRFWIQGRPGHQRFLSDELLDLTPTAREPFEADLVHHGFTDSILTSSDNVSRSQKAIEGEKEPALLSELATPSQTVPNKDFYHANYWNLRPQSSVPLNGKEKDDAVEQLVAWLKSFDFRPTETTKDNEDDSGLSLQQIQERSKELLWWRWPEIGKTEDPQDQARMVRKQAEQYILALDKVRHARKIIASFRPFDSNRNPLPGCDWIPKLELNELLRSVINQGRRIPSLSAYETDDLETRARKQRRDMEQLLGVSRFSDEILLAEKQYEPGNVRLTSSFSKPHSAAIMTEPQPSNVSTEVVHLKETLEKLFPNFTNLNLQFLKQYLPFLEAVLSTNYNDQTSIPRLEGFHIPPLELPTDLVQERQALNKWLAENHSAVKIARDDENYQHVPKDVHKNLIRSEQLSLQEAGIREAYVKDYIQDQAHEFYETARWNEAYKYVLQKLSSNLMRSSSSADTKSGPPTERTSEKLLDLSEIVYQGMFGPQPPLQRSIYPPPPIIATDEATNAATTTYFARDGHKFRSAELQSGAALALGKAYLRNERWREAAEQFVDAKAWASKVCYPALVARIELWEGIAMMGLGDWDKAEACFLTAGGCKGHFREAELQQEWVRKLEKAKSHGSFELWGRVRSAEKSR